MNPFRQRRKAKEVGGDGGGGGAGGGSVPYLSGKTFRRNKKPLPPKPELELDLAHVLPSTDNFRTSLLMPNLTARFSMLRAQDDPFSLIGKASDDSVIAKRVSTFGDLSDIPEASSIRPPFTQSRTGSTGSTDGYATDDDSAYGGNASILGRARPGEGNNLFGGRQKIYKIAVGGSSSNKDLTRSGARFLYEHDVHRSAFQTMRDQRRRPSDEDNDPVATTPGGIEDASTPPSGDSPLLDGDRHKRETTSSTASGQSNGRASTAATSVASHGTSTPVSAARATSKTRRLYDHGLDQHMHEQQSSALSRLDQLARQRATGTTSPPPGAIASSASSLRERPVLSLSHTTSPAFRPLSPSPPPPSLNSRQQPGGREPSLGETKSGRSTPIPNHLQSPPLSPVESEDGDAFSLGGAIRPQDRGKATATGAFARPRQPYDEDQYSERQRQMHEGRTTPPSARGSPSPTNTATSTDARGRRLPDDGRSRSGSEASVPASGPARPIPPSTDDRPSPVESTPGTLAPAAPGTFLASFSDASSDGESETEGERLLDLEQQRARTPPSGRRSPLTLSRPSSTAASSQRHNDQSTDANAVSKATEPTSEDQRTPSRNDAPAADGETPDLRGLVRQHLRSDSNQSAFPTSSRPVSLRYPPPDQLPPMPVPIPRPSIVAMPSPILSGTDGVNHGDAPSDIRSQEELDASSQPLPPPLRTTPTAPPMSESAPTSDSGQIPSDEATAQHSRNLSLETRERMAFADELAQRRKRVQENLKSFTESDASPLEPVTEPSRISKSEKRALSPLRTTTALGLLMSKSAPPSAPTTPQPVLTPVKPETSSKAMKMLGITTADTVGASEPSRDPSADADRPRTEEKRVFDLRFRSRRLVPLCRLLHSRHGIGARSGGTPGKSLSDDRGRTRTLVVRKVQRPRPHRRRHRHRRRTRVSRAIGLDRTSHPLGDVCRKRTA